MESMWGSVDNSESVFSFYHVGSRTQTLGQQAWWSAPLPLPYPKFIWVFRLLISL